MILQLVAAILGTMAFALLFSVPKEHYLICGCIGCIGWAIYLLCTEVLPMTPAEAEFLAAATVMLCSRGAAAWKKCPVAVFYICGLFPLIPGGAFYRCIYSMVLGDAQAAGSAGVLTAKLIFALVIGVVLARDLPFGRKKARS